MSLTPRTTPLFVHLVILSLLAARRELVSSTFGLPIRRFVTFHGGITFHEPIMASAVALEWLKRWPIDELRGEMGHLGRKTESLETAKLSDFKALLKRGRRDSNPQPSDRQSKTGLITPYRKKPYRPFLGRKRGLQVVYKSTLVTLTSQYPLQIDELFDEHLSGFT